MPTPVLVRDYVHWLTSIGGSCSTGIGLDEAIGMVPAVRLRAPSGKAVNYTGPQTDELTPSMIAYFDRRLGVLSPFSAESRN
jgi:hypothetical protein